MAAAMPWVVFHVPVGAAPALAGGTGPGTALAQAPFGRAVDGIGWSMSGSLVVPALPATPPAEKHRDIIHYTAVDGDTLRALASKYGLSVNTLLWSNPKLVDRLIAGQEVVIPPVDGVLVKVGATDTLASLAQKYRAESDAIIDFNLRSEEHTSELQSQSNLVCRLLLEKKKNNRLTDSLRCTLPSMQNLTR